MKKFIAAILALLLLSSPTYASVKPEYKCEAYYTVIIYDTGKAEVKYRVDVNDPYGFQMYHQNVFGFPNRYILNSDVPYKGEITVPYNSVKDLDFLGMPTIRCPLAKEQLPQPPKSYE